MVSSWLILKMTSFVSFRRRKQSCNNILNHFLYHKRTRQLEYTLYYNQVPHQYSIQFIVFPCNILVVILYFTILIPITVIVSSFGFMQIVLCKCKVKGILHVFPVRLSNTATNSTTNEYVAFILITLCTHINYMPIFTNPFTNVWLPTNYKTNEL